MFNGLASCDLEDSVAVGGLELVTIKTVREAEAAAPGSAAEFAEQRGLAIARG